MTRLAFILALLTGGWLASPALASNVAVPGEWTVHDDAALFSNESIAKAKDAFHAEKFSGPVKVVVRTFKAIPDDKKTEFAAVDKKDKNAVGRFFTTWAEELARADGSKPGIYILLYFDGKAYWQKVITDKAGDLHRHFSNEKCNAVSHKFHDPLDLATRQKLNGTALHAILDPALTDAANYIAGELKNTSLPAANHKTTAHNAGGGGRSIMSYVCIGLCIMLGVWLVIGLIRAFTGGGGGGGMGGGGYGGGGGGFMSSLVGGMFGAMAGMWMYNNFFGGGMNSLGANESFGDSGGAIDTGEGDYTGGAASDDAGGGDWGGGDAGGDAGGGDWGGGGDFGGGGGDFGGGDW